MNTTLRKALIAGGLTTAALVGGAIGGPMLNGTAVAQTSTTTPASGDSSATQPAAPGDRAGRPPKGTALTGEALDKAKAAALAAVEGSTFDNAFQKDDGTIFAHVTKADGTHVHVVMDKDYKVTSVNDAPKGGGRGGPRGTALTGDALEKAKAAALAAVPGATFDRAMAKDDGTIHAHVTKADGTHVHVSMDKDYKVTSVEDAPKGGPGRGGPRGPRPGDAAPAAGTTPTTVASS